MPVIYEKCDEDHEVFDVIEKLLKQPQFAEVKAAGVTISVLMASSDESGYPVKLHGYPCLAVIRVVPYKQRVQGMTDAEITVDKAVWDSMAERDRMGLIDHELSHLEVVYDKHGEVKTDDLGRPKLRLRLHDWELGGFRGTAERYGDSAPEVKAAHDFKDKFGQLLFDFAAA